MADVIIWDDAMIVGVSDALRESQSHTLTQQLHDRLLELLYGGDVAPAVDQVIEAFHERFGSILFETFTEIDIDVMMDFLDLTGRDIGVFYQDPSPDTSEMFIDSVRSRLSSFLSGLKVSERNTDKNESIIPEPAPTIARKRVIGGQSPKTNADQGDIPDDDKKSLPAFRSVKKDKKGTRGIKGFDDGWQTAHEEKAVKGSLEIYLKEAGKTPLLTRQEEVELADRIKKGDKEAKSHMIRANLRLVVKIAHDYSYYGLGIEDLIQEGNIGLMKACERFDPNKGGKLSTYAAWWIKQSIKRALANQSRTIRLPVHMVDKISKMRRVSLVLSEELGRDPNHEELRKELGMEPDKFAVLMSSALNTTSLDAPISDEIGSAEFGEMIADEKARSPLELLSHKNMHMQLDDLLEVLDERERKIIDARFGLAGNPPRTLEQVGRDFGVTRERIRQLQNIALTKLRRALQKKEAPGPKPLRKGGMGFDDDFFRDEDDN